MHHFSIGSELLQDVDFILYPCRNLIDNKAFNIRLDSNLVLIEIFYKNNDIWFELGHFFKQNFNKEQVEFHTVRCFQSKQFLQIVFFASFQFKNSEMLLNLFVFFKELQELNIACLVTICILTLIDIVKVIGVSFFAQFKDRLSRKLPHKQFSLLRRSSSLLHLEQLPTQIFLKEDGNRKDIKVGWTENSRDNNDANLGHVDRELKNEVGKGTDSVFDDLTHVLGKVDQRLPDQFILFKKALEISLPFSKKLVFKREFRLKNLLAKVTSVTTSPTTWLNGNSSNPEDCGVKHSS